MKKGLRNLAFLFLTLFIFTNCGKDENNQSENNESIVGIWWLYEISLPDSDDPLDYRGKNQLLIFDADGEYQEISENTKDYGTYKRSGNTITLYNSEGEQIRWVEITIRNITSDKMELNWTHVANDGSKAPWINRYKRR